jgi:hypothetical protein
MWARRRWPSCLPCCAGQTERVGSSTLASNRPRRPRLLLSRNQEARSRHHEHRRSKAAHLSFWPPCRGGCAGTAETGAGCTRRSPNPTELPPQPEPKTGRSAETDTDPLSIVPPLRVLLQIDPPADRPPFLAALSPRAAASFVASTERPCFNPMVVTSREKAGFHPARLTQRRQATALHALPRLPTAPSTSRSVWSAPACGRS